MSNLLNDPLYFVLNNVEFPTFAAVILYHPSWSTILYRLAISSMNVRWLAMLSQYPLGTWENVETSHEYIIQ